MVLFYTAAVAAVAVTLGFVAIGVVALLCLRRSSDSHRQIDEEVVYMDKIIQVIEEIPDDLKVSRSNEMRVHWETSDGILVKDLPRLVKKLSVSVGGNVVLSKGKLVSEAMPSNLNTSEAVGNLLWQLAKYGHQLSKATAVAPIINKPERAHYMCQSEDDMKKLITSHDLNSFPLRVARAINQQVIAPAFAFLYSVVDVPRGKPFLDSRNAEKSWTVQIELPSLEGDVMRNVKTKRMSMVELISSDAKSKAEADIASNRVVIRHLRQSRCCLPSTSPDFFYFDWTIEIHLSADASEMMESRVFVREVFCEGGTKDFKAALNQWFRVGQQL